MNCRFCGNFVPDGSDSCPVCGRRPEEDPIGKLLSENRPGMDNSDQKTAPDTTASAGLKPKNLGGSIVAVVASIAAWIYAASAGVIGDLRALFGMDGVPSTLPADTGGLLIVGLVVVATVVGIIGLISLISRGVNNIKYMS